MIRDDMGRILMTERGINPDKGKLDMPGGFVMFGEQLEDAAVREAKEEVGVDVEIGRCIGHWVDGYNYQGIDDYSFVVVMEAKIVNGEARPADRREIASLEWVDPAGVDKSRLAFTYNEKFLLSAKGKETREK